MEIFFTEQGDTFKYPGVRLCAMAQTVLGNSLSFLDRLGVFDVVLPFLLAFTVTYALLERSKIFGMHQSGETRKNLNAMAAFVIGFLVVASSKLVAAIVRVSSNMVILLLLGIFFIMLVGHFYSKEDWEKNDLGWPKHAFIVLMFVALLGIFLDAIPTDAGESWLSYGWRWISYWWDSAAVLSIILIVGIIIFMRFVTKEPKPANGGGR